MYSVSNLVGYCMGFNDTGSERGNTQARNYCAVKAAFFFISIYAMQYLTLQNKLLGIPMQELNLGKHIAIAVVLSPEAGAFKALDFLFHLHISLLLKSIGVSAVIGFSFLFFIRETEEGSSISLGGYIARKLTGHR